jgi:hypothetical protein
VNFKGKSALILSASDVMQALEFWLNKEVLAGSVKVINFDLETHTDAHTKSYRIGIETQGESDGETNSND